MVEEFLQLRLSPFRCFSKLVKCMNRFSFHLTAAPSITLSALAACCRSGTCSQLLPFPPFFDSNPLANLASFFLFLSLPRSLSVSVCLPPSLSLNQSIRTINQSINQSACCFHHHCCCFCCSLLCLLCSTPSLLHNKVTPLLSVSSQEF